MNESLNRMTSPGASDTTELPPASAGIEQIERGHTANPFSCNVCKRSYTRVDHLARHYRSRKYHPNSNVGAIQARQDLTFLRYT
jgi:uncharacterized Zn-finger protein